MEPQGIFSGTISSLERALDLRSMKHNLIVSNISNVDTPDYKAFDLCVEEEMRKRRSGGDIELKRTQNAHLPLRGIRLGRSSVSIISSSCSAVREDGNSVDIDKAMAGLSENNLMYNALAQIISRKFAGIKNVIQGGTR